MLHLAGADIDGLDGRDSSQMIARHCALVEKYFDATCRLGR